MKRFFKALGWVVVFTIMLAVLIILGQMIINALISSSAINEIASEAVCFIAALIVAWVLYRYLKHEPVMNIGFVRPSAGWHLFSGFLVALFIFGAGFGLSVAAGWIKIEAVIATTRGVILSFIFYTFVAFFEELLCRGLILGQLISCTNKYLALAISAVIFSMAHFFNPNVSAISLINIFLAGIILGSVYIFTRSLWFGISLHLFWNFFQDQLGFAVSGTSFAPALELSEPGNKILTGGDFGFEGSIISTIMLAIAITVILAVYIQKEKKQISC